MEKASQSALVWNSTFLSVIVIIRRGQGELTLIGSLWMKYISLHLSWRFWLGTLRLIRLEQCFLTRNNFAHSHPYIWQHLEAFLFVPTCGRVWYWHGVAYPMQSISSDEVKKPWAIVIKNGKFVSFSPVTFIRLYAYAYVIGVDTAVE